MATPAMPPGMPAPPPVSLLDSDYTAFIAVQTVFVSLAVASVAARLFVRSFIIKKAGLDELFIVIALIFALASFTLAMIMSHDREKFFASHPQLTLSLFPGLKLDEITPSLTILSVTFTRVSVGFFLLRIVATGQRWKEKIWIGGLYVLMGFSIVTGVPTAMITILQCRPIAKLWNPLLPGSCWSPHVALYAGDFYGAVSVVIDWTLATLPIIFMWKVQISTKLKAGICILMGLGYFTGICALIKTILLNQAGGTTLHGNATVTELDLAYWAYLEIYIGIIAASIPTLRPLFSRKMREERNKRYKGNSPGGSDPQQQRSGSKQNGRDLGLVDARKSSYPSSRSDSDDQGRAMGKSIGGSTYAEKEIPVPSAFDYV